MEEYTRVETEERDYFTTIPNMLFDLPLTHTAFKLYCWYRKVCGNRTDDGACWMSLDTVTKRCRMDRRTVISAREQLLEHDLIKMTHERNCDGSTRVVVTLND